MGTPAAVAGDLVLGTCVGHMMPSAGGPVPAPPLPFAAPMTQQLVASVLIAGSPAVVVGSTGTNTNSPHVGLSDAFAAAVTQRATVTVGSTTVQIGGRGAAPTGARCQLCLAPVGTLQGSVVSVLVGGGPGG